MNSLSTEHFRHTADQVLDEKGFWTSVFQGMGKLLISEVLEKNDVPYFISFCFTGGGGVFLLFATGLVHSCVLQKHVAGFYAPLILNVQVKCTSFI